MPRGDDGGDGEGKGEGRSVAEPALDGNLTTEQFDQPAHQGEAQAGPLVVRGIEAAEDVGQPLGFDAPAGVAHGELHLVFLLLGLQQDRAILRRVADRIAHQVVHDAAQRAAISIHIGEIGECLDLHIDVLFPDLIACPGEGVAKNIDGPESIHADLAPPGIEFGDFDQIGHEVVEPFRFLLGAMQHIRLQGPQVARET